MTDNGISVLTFIVCEDIREEINGKPSFMGVYPGGVASVPRAEAEAGHALPSLCFYILLGGVPEGEIEVGVAVSNPDGSLTKEAAQAVNIPVGTRRHAIQLKMAPFKLKGLGNYGLNLRVGNWRHDFQFSFDPA